MQIFELGTGVN